MKKLTSTRLTYEELWDDYATKSKLKMRSMEQMTETALRALGEEVKDIVDAWVEGNVSLTKQSIRSSRAKLLLDLDRVKTECAEMDTVILNNQIMLCSGTILKESEREMVFPPVDTLAVKRDTINMTCQKLSENIDQFLRQQSAQIDAEIGSILKCDTNR